jgi:TRAP transporter TAXI family solute receptor
MAVSPFLRAHRVYFVIAVLIVVVLAVVGLWKILGIFQPLPPHTVTMATGPEGGAYRKYAERYRAILAREGINLRLLPTNGAMENLAMLNDPHSGVSIGILQGGTTNAESSPDLESLGTVFFEPLWFFCRDTCQATGLEGLRGRRISVGPEGSGTRFLTLELLSRIGVTENFAQLIPYTFQTSAEKLLSGDIDAAFILSSWDSPVVQRLLAAENIDLVSFPHAEALIALDPFLTKLVVPAGVGDIVHNRPPKDTEVLGTKASLVVRSDLHPAIQYLLLDAADQVHSGTSIFQKAGHFPGAESVGLPLSEEARRFYRSGQPFLQRYLPFWLGVFITRLVFMLIPVVGILYPLVRVAPVLFGWKMQRRVFKLYNELRAIEQAMESPNGESSTDDLVDRLNHLEEKADHLWVPVSAMGTLYLFKMHINFVRKRLENPQAEV